MTLDEKIIADLLEEAREYYRLSDGLYRAWRYWYDYKPRSREAKAALAALLRNDQDIDRMHRELGCADLADLVIASHKNTDYYLAAGAKGVPATTPAPSLFPGMNERAA